ncbi:DUF5063 domain-containing protein [Phycicoccus endophyticus]|uniref:DUF5063 domain-containing protein n=1 Tax=Phycicoccus endophyticus TaxID=1690220 RepID=UPI00140DB82C|nr:DUF5063 domain-containing protein [Phycicoccus endophyticus]NHI20816.1 DUF5063 domain-containing protein [Phycicoccus endophyticus]GGL44194.1 hypothetical protein GCM10012283_28480 [Phycicoccus endophyticus]
MSEPGAPAPELAGDWGRLAAETALEARTFVGTLREVASGQAPDATLPVLLLALSQVLLAGARLGAVEDVLPEERFEPDPGPDPELDPLREALANLFEGLDEYADVVDPLTTPELGVGSVSNDLVDVAAALEHGLEHHDSGRPLEALWWWQFSYLAHWGERAAAALRVVQSLLAHVRLDADDETVAEAEFDALHP